jgi:hypothetical protein
MRRRKFGKKLLTTKGYVLEPNKWYVGAQMGKSDRSTNYHYFSLNISVVDPDPLHFGNLDPHPDPHSHPDPDPHQLKIRIRLK